MEKWINQTLTTVLVIFHSLSTELLKIYHFSLSFSLFLSLYLKRKLLVNLSLLVPEWVEFLLCILWSLVRSPVKNITVYITDKIETVVHWFYTSQAVLAEFSAHGSSIYYIYIYCLLYWYIQCAKFWWRSTYRSKFQYRQRHLETLFGVISSRGFHVVGIPLYLVIWNMTGRLI